MWQSATPKTLVCIENLDQKGQWCCVQLSLGIRTLGNSVLCVSVKSHGNIPGVDLEDTNVFLINRQYYKPWVCRMRIDNFPGRGTWLWLLSNPLTGILLAKSGIRESGEHSWKVRDRTHIWLRSPQHHRFRGPGGECIKRGIGVFDTYRLNAWRRAGVSGERWGTGYFFLKKNIVTFMELESTDSNAKKKLLYLEGVWKFCL